MDWMRVFWWTVQQIAYAKNRHADMTQEQLAPNMHSILCLHKWWEESGWPEPLSVVFDGVKIESDIGWAATAMRDAALNSH